MFSSAPGEQEANRVTHGMSRCVIAFLTAFAAFGHLRYGCGMLWLWDWCCQMLSVSDQMPKIGIEMVRVLMILVMMFFFLRYKTYWAHYFMTFTRRPRGLGNSLLCMDSCGVQCAGDSSWDPSFQDQATASDSNSDHLLNHWSRIVSSCMSLQYTSLRWQLGFGVLVPAASFGF